MEFHITIKQLAALQQLVHARTGTSPSIEELENQLTAGLTAHEIITLHQDQTPVLLTKAASRIWEVSRKKIGESLTYVGSKLSK